MAEVQVKISAVPSPEATNEAPRPVSETVDAVPVGIEPTPVEALEVEEGDVPSHRPSEPPPRGTFTEKGPEELESPFQTFVEGEGGDANAAEGMNRPLRPGADGEARETQGKCCCCTIS
mmetsp:Transcript_63131/g.133265  ORF Transcript_63131/g.133265 Transcript_63131/m.133265 type:complete len:119 (+) Transcript_63131:281-637(+)